MQREIVQWSSVKQVTYRSTGERVVRHVLRPILPEHLGPDGVGPLPGIGLLLNCDLGRTLVVDVPLERDHEVDVQVTD